MTQTHVLIVGAGPVGLITALGLAQSDVNVTVLEKESNVVHSPRAMVYHWSALPRLEHLGLLTDAQAAGFTDQERSYVVFETGETITQSLALLADELRHPYSLHLGQNRLSEIVLEHLQQFPNAEIIWDTQVTALSQNRDGVSVHAETPADSFDFRAEWVVGADGAQSVVRHALGVHFDGVTWPERFVATNVRYDFEQLGYSKSNYLIDPSYGAVIAKIDNTGLWRCTYCEDASLPEETLAERIPEYFNGILPEGDDYALEAYTSYRMHQRTADHFRIGRVLLAGDAAHATNPTSGFGLLSGMHDAHPLYETLAAVIHSEAHQTILDDYAQDRRDKFLELASPTSTQTKQLIFDSDDPVRLREDLDKIRETSRNKELLRDSTMIGKRLETPSLLVQRQKT